MLLFSQGGSLAPNVSLAMAVESGSVTLSVSGSCGGIGFDDS